MTGTGFKDHFSGLAQAYAEARPEYPDELFEVIAKVVPATARVWEPGCGSGQATRGLAQRFAQVHATEPSASQLERHWARDGAVGNVTLAVEPGEKTALADASVQLVAVAQALHWFDRSRFFGECARVLTPGGVLAAWGYDDFVAPEGMVDAVEAFRATIEAYWPPERDDVAAHYAGFEWPFPALPAPELWLQAQWNLGHFLRYLSSMSAVGRCRADTGQDPVSAHAPDLSRGWGDPDESRLIQWPLFLHLRRKP
jgi:SAM-dependent methyltransferase